jgi:tricorn protease
MRLPLLLLLLPSLLNAQTLLLRQPTVSEKQIAFAYGGNIWIVDRAGGDARRITSFQGEESNPRFSPDGKWIAFSGQYGGASDVYVVPTEGGEPKRLTWHPGPDEVTGWTPDGKQVVFISGRANVGGVTRFYTVSVDGGFPTALPMPRGFQGSFSPDGKRFAYRMPNAWDEEWRNYRGGQNRPVWIFDLASHEVVSPPWTDSKDEQPVWVGETVFFLSDRDWAMNVWAYDTRSKQLRQVTKFKDYDVKSLEAGAGAVVFEQAGRIHLMVPKTGESKPVPITVRGDFPWLTPAWKDVSSRIVNGAISPTGKRAVFEARGEIFTVPVEKGDARNLTSTPGVAERTPSWSPDGKWISYFSDKGGEYHLVLEAQDGQGTPREIQLPTPSFQFTPAWSPDSKKFLFTDTHLNLWVVDIATGKATKADTDNYMAPDRSMNPAWSPDSRWIAYTKRLDTQIHAIFAYDTQTEKVVQLTDGMSDATWPAWDASGKYLYFLASTNFALNTGWLDMTSYERPVTRALYLAVLKKGEPSPLLPESDEEGAAEAPKPAAPAAGAGPAAASGSAVTVTMDLDGLAARTISLGVVPRDYTQLQAGPAGMVFFLENIPATGATESNPG